MWNYVELCGFVMIVEEGWVGKKFKDGSFQKEKELEKVSKVYIERGFSRAVDMRTSSPTLTSDEAKAETPRCRVESSK